MSISDKMNARRVIDQQRKEKESAYYSQESVNKRNEKKQLEMKRQADNDYPEVSKIIYDEIVKILDDKSAPSLESRYALKYADWSYAGYILDKLNADKKFKGVRFGHDARNNYIEYYFN